MNPDVIVIDDSPPTSPISKKELSYPANCIETLDLTNDDFPTSVETTSLWTQKTSNYIKNTMNFSIIEKNNNKTQVSCEVVNLTTSNNTVTKNVVNTKIRQMLQKRDIYTQNSTEITHTNDPIKYNVQQYYPSNYAYGFKSSNTEMGTVCYPVYDGPTCFTPVAYPHPILRNNTGYFIKNYLPTPVKLNENLQYVQPNITQSYYHEDYNSHYIPEYIDINNLMNYNNFDKNSINGMSSPNTRLDSNKKQQTTDIDTESTTLKINKRYNKNLVPLFLKRNRSVNTLNKMKVIDLSNENINSQMEVVSAASSPKNENVFELKDDDLDVVYVGAYAREPKYPGVQPTVFKLPVVEEHEKENIENQSSECSPLSISVEASDNQIIPDDNASDPTTKGKRKRKPILTVPRRNPKRQVQIEKDYLKLLDNVICESKKEAKTRRPKRPNKSNSTDDCKRLNSDASNQSNKRTTRQAINCGAIYRPPSPLTKNHFRKWPVSGMHERPEFNPVTGKLEQFDSIIRNISIAYQEQLAKKDVDTKNKVKKNVTEEKITEENKELWMLCHEMFHHVFAYGATVKSLKNQENSQQEGKLEFLRDLSLMEPLAGPLNLSTQNKTKSDSNEHQCKETEKEILDLKDLMQNSLLLYCLTNDIDRDHVAKYIDSLVPEEIIQWSNKQFNLVD